MLSIHLHNLLFFAHHGLYEEETVVGNQFELNISVRHQPAQMPINHLSDTINYVAVYELVKKRMSIPTHLLETLVMEMAEQILAQFSLAEEVTIAIRKLHPPIAGMKGSVGVSFQMTRPQKS